MDGEGQPRRQGLCTSRAGGEWFLGPLQAVPVPDGAAVGAGWRGAPLRFFRVTPARCGALAGDEARGSRCGTLRRIDSGARERPGCDEAAPTVAWGWGGRVTSQRQRRLLHLRRPRRAWASREGVASVLAGGGRDGDGRPRATSQGSRTRCPSQPTLDPRSRSRGRNNGLARIAFFSSSARAAWAWSTSRNRLTRSAGGWR